MPLYQPERLRRLGRRLSHGGPLAGIEAALLIGLAVVVARLVWAIVTPVGPPGSWQPPQPVGLPARARLALFARFDPFYRTAPDDDGAQAVTSLPLNLMGDRLNAATGLGSAIIATPQHVNQAATGKAGLGTAAG